MKTQLRRSAMTLVEVLAIVAVLAICAGSLLPGKTHHSASAPRIRCVNNLKCIGLAFRIFATDNNDRFPPEIMLTNGVPLKSIDALSVFLTLSNELSTPKILLCPADATRKLEDSFARMTSRNISYFASLSASQSMPQAFLAGDRNLETNGKAAGPGLLQLITNVPLSWSKEIHNDQGSIAMGDGSVQQFSSSRLKQALLDQGAQLATNYLAIP